MASQPQPPTTVNSSSSSAATSRPPVTLSPSTHLDQGAYVRGTHGITLGEYILIHPRAQLITVHGPLNIDDKSIISERCIVGGPMPQSSSSSATAAGSGAGADAKASPSLPSPLTGSGEHAGDDGDEEEPDPVKTTIGQSVYLYANSHVHAGATIRDAVILESNVTILPGVTVGAHSKICAGVTIDSDVDEWTVVMSNGDFRRRRRRRRQDQSDLATNDGKDPNDGYEDAAELVENIRLKAMDKEREGTVTIFRVAQRMASLAKKR